MRWLATGSLAVLVLLGLGTPVQAQTPDPKVVPRVVVVGVAGLRWDDVGPHTPALARLARISAVGVLSVKTLPAVTCPADGWLTLGAGARAEAYDVGRDACTAQLPEATERVRQRNLDSTDQARLGALAAALGGLVSAGPGAALAGGPGADQRVRVVDGGTVDRSHRAESLAASDAAVAEQMRSLGPGADLLVVGLSEGVGDDTARLHVAMATGPDFPRGGLRSASTRRDGYVQLIDVAPTVLDVLDRPVPDHMDGQPWTVSGSARDVAGLVDLDTRAVEGKRATVPFFVVLIAGCVLLVAVLRRHPRAVRAVAVGGLGTIGASYALMLVPWWRAPLAPLVLVAGALAVGSGLAAIALRTRNPVGWACGGIWALLTVDLLTGGHLQVESPAGYSTLVAGRFAGLGNVAFGVYAACALFATATATPSPAPTPTPTRTAALGGRPAGERSRRSAALWVAAAGSVAVAVDGAPPWGSDVGGVLALLPAFVLLGLLLSRTAVTVLRLILAGVGAAAVVTAFALADYARPASSRTHLGRFVAQVRDGTAGDVLSRKAHAIGNLLFGNPVTALLPLVAVGVVYLFLRPPTVVQAAFEAEPDFRHALLAVGLMAALGFALNDSGPAVLALAVLVAALVAVGVTGGVAAGRDGDQHP